LRGAVVRDLLACTGLARCHLHMLRRCDCVAPGPVTIEQLCHSRACFACSTVKRGQMAEHDGVDVFHVYACARAPVGTCSVTAARWAAAALRVISDPALRLLPSVCIAGARYNMSSAMRCRLDGPPKLAGLNKQPTLVSATDHDWHLQLKRCSGATGSCVRSRMQRRAPLTLPCRMRCSGLSRLGRSRHGRHLHT
jgi:hypothetical protein